MMGITISSTQPYETHIINIMMSPSQMLKVLYRCRRYFSFAQVWSTAQTYGVAHPPPFYKLECNQKHSISFILLASVLFNLPFLYTMMLLFSLYSTVLMSCLHMYPPSWFGLMAYIWQLLPTASVWRLTTQGLAVIMHPSSLVQLSWEIFFSVSFPLHINFHLLKKSGLKTLAEP